MIYIFTALYPEAKPLIRAFSLKRAVTGLPFDVYENTDSSQEQDLRLVVTGVGAAAAACGVAAVLGKYGADEGDHLINIGTCAQEVSAKGLSEEKREEEKNKETGEIYLCHKITDRNTGHTYYPDMLYHTSLPEAEVITEPAVWKRAVLKEEVSEKAAVETLPQSTLLHDMEGAAVYQAGSYWMGPHQMSFLKVVSDHGDGEKITPQTLEEAVNRNLELIKGYVLNLGQVLRKNREEQEKEQHGRMEAETLCRELHCSQTMRAAVEQCVRYWTLAKVDYQQVLDKMRADGELPCRDRREGKKRFEELKQRLL